LARKRDGLLCGRCWQRHPDRARNQAGNLAVVVEDPPWWLAEFAEFAADRHCMGRACVMITALGRLLRDGQPASPQALLERSRRPGRSAGALARTLEDFFVARDLAFGLDQAARLAAGRRQRRVDGAPHPLRPAVALFGEHLVRSRERARRAATHLRADSTIESALANVRDLARFLVEERAKIDWATVQTADIEAFLNAQPANRRRRLSNARQFFRWARRNKLVLVDPTTPVTLTLRPGFTGRTLSVAEQRRLFRRWTSGQPDVHPHEALVGLLALLHAMSGAELRALRVDDIDLRDRTMRVGGRPHRVPLDPASVAAVEACLDHRAGLGTRNPHVIVTKVTRPRLTSASAAYLTHVLDPAGVRTKALRSTRLVDLLVSLDPKLVAEALGMNADGLLAYVADTVDPDRLASSNM
jgi:integrase